MHPGSSGWAEKLVNAGRGVGEQAVASAVEMVAMR